MVKHNTAYVGFTTEARNDWSDFAPEPKAPRNYTDPVKKSKYIANAREKQQGEAKLAFLQCSIRELVVLSRAKPVIVKEGERLDYLSSLDRIAVIGPTLLRHLLLREHVDSGGTLTHGQRWLVRSSRDASQYLVDDVNNATAIFDPVHAITCTTQLDGNLDLVAKAYGVGEPDLNDASSMAAFCQALCGLLGV